MLLNHLCRPSPCQHARLAASMQKVSEGFFPCFPQQQGLVAAHNPLCVHVPPTNVQCAAEGCFLSFLFFLLYFFYFFYFFFYFFPSHPGMVAPSLCLPTSASTCNP